MADSRSVCRERALANVVNAARELDALFDRKNQGPKHIPGWLDQWKLDGRYMTGEASQVLLSLHDYLNDLRAAEEVANES